MKLSTRREEFKQIRNKKNESENKTGENTKMKWKLVTLNWKQIMIIIIEIVTKTGSIYNKTE